MKLEYGVRWQEAVGRDMRIVNKEKFFATSEKRRKFCERLEQSSNFLEFVAWCEPRKAEVAQ